MNPVRNDSIGSDRGTEQSFNNKGAVISNGVKNSKIPVYVMVSILSVMLGIAWNAMLNKRKPDILLKGDLRVTYNHYKEEDVGHPYRFFVSVSKRGSPLASDEGSNNIIPSPSRLSGAVKVYHLKGEEFHPNPKKTDFSVATMAGVEGGGFYAHLFESRNKSQRYYFFMEIDSPEGIITMPESAIEKGIFYRVTYKQDPNKWGLLVHILLMLVALFLLIHAFYFAFDYLWNKTEWDISKAVSSILWGVVCYGVSSFPLGFWIAYEKYGVVWGGLPIGWDVTDNKTLFNFFYWLILLLLMKYNVVGKKTFIWLTILGGILTLVIRFALPHGDI